MILRTQLPYLYDIYYIIFVFRIHVDFLPCALFRLNWFHLSPVSCVICLEPIKDYFFSTRPIVRQGRCRCRRLSGYLLQHLDNKYLVADVNRERVRTKGICWLPLPKATSHFKRVYSYTYLYKKNSCSSQTGRSVVLSYMTMCFIKLPSATLLRHDEPKVGELDVKVQLIKQCVHMIPEIRWFWYRYYNYETYLTEIKTIFTNKLHIEREKISNGKPWPRCA